MDYEQARSRLRHARTRVHLDAKNIAPNTKLYRLSEGSTPEIGLRLYNSTILIWFPDGRIVIEAQEHWTKLTRDRLNTYLPAGFRIWSEKPLWFVRLPGGGCRQGHRAMYLDAKGNDSSLCPRLNELDARAMAASIRGYAKEYVGALLRGDIHAAPGKYAEANAFVPDLRDNLEGWRLSLASGKLWDCLLRGDHPFSLINNAGWCAQGHRNTSPPGHFLTSKEMNVIVACAPEYQELRRKPRTDKQYVAQLEGIAQLTPDQKGILALRPASYRKTFQNILEDYLFRVFGFQELL